MNYIYAIEDSEEGRQVALKIAQARKNEMLLLTPEQMEVFEKISYISVPDDKEA